MKIILKSLKQVNYEVNIENTTISIGELKKITEKAHSIEADTIKLVFNGVVLKDENTVDSYGIQEGNILVMMISKAKVQNKQEAPVTQSQSQSVQKEVKKEENQSSSAGVSSNQNQQTSVGNSQTQSQNQNQTQSTKQEKKAKDYKNEVNTLIEMGFPKEYSESAIKAAKGNISIAIEFLYNGIPEVPINENEDNDDNAINNQEPASESDVVKRIASIVKVLCANDPSKLQEIILGLQQTQPEIIDLIKKNENEFKTLISQPVTEQDIAAFQELNSSGMFNVGNEQGQGQSSSNGQGQGSAGQNKVVLSKTEYEAVQRLKEFGFSEMDAAQAYFACDKNEEYALNFLFEMKAQEGNFNDYEEENKENKEKKDEEKK